MTTTNPPRFRPVPAIPVVVKGRDAANDPTQSTSCLDVSNEPAKINMRADIQQASISGATQEPTHD